jgi:hypothetical protein
MTKTLHVKVSLPLHEDELDAAEQKVGAKNFKVAIADLVTTHLPGAVVTHEITSPEPVKPPRKPRVAQLPNPVIPNVSKSDVAKAHAQDAKTKAA